MAETYDTLVIGAGPGGLQLGYLLGRAGRSYVILEKQDRAGSWFAVNPRNRQLLSINKPHNHYTERDYNLRHDWNSLLSDDDESDLFPRYTDQLYPDAGLLHQYLNDFAERHALEIAYGTEVTRISRAAAGVGFDVTDASGETRSCRTLVLATGCVSEHVPDIPGIELATTYAKHTMEREAYRNKKVAIIGGGNSAFEVANHIAGDAAAIHMLVREPVKHAWQSHFVGDVRAVNNTLLDMYQLKSLHATLGFQAKRIERAPDGRLRVHLEEDCPHWSRPGTFQIVHDYDFVITCTGWRYINPAMFDDDVRPDVCPHEKYPALSPTWESSVPGLFFAGTVMASRDKRAASGFIHGFRYNTRALFKLLEERFHDTPLPSTDFAVTDAASLRALAKHVIKRFSTSSGLYQMNGYLTDVLVARGGSLSYIDELPLELVKTRADLQQAEHCFTLTLEYGFDRYGKHIPSTDFIHPSDPFDTSCSAYLHPVIRTWRDGVMGDEFHLGESLMIRYDDHFARDSFGPNYTEAYARMNENRVMNFLNASLKVTDETFPEQHFSEETLKAVFRPWSEAEVAEYRAKHGAPMDDGKPCRAD